MLRMEKVALILLLISSGTVLGQPAPPTGGFSGSGGQQGGPGGGPGNGPGGGPPPFSQNLPELNTAAVSTARSEARAAHTELTHAQSALAQLTRAKQEEFDFRPEVADLVKSVAANKLKYDQLAMPVLKALSTQPAYESVQASAVRARENVEALRSQPSASAPDRLTAAQAALAAKDAVTKLETETLAADASVSAARQEYAQSAASLAALRAQFDIAMKQDGDYLSARRTLEDAHAKASEADAKVADAQKDLAEQRAAHAAAMAASQNQMRQANQNGRGPNGPPGR